MKPLKSESAGAALCRVLSLALRRLSLDLAL